MTICSAGDGGAGGGVGAAVTVDAAGAVGAGAAAPIVGATGDAPGEGPAVTRVPPAEVALAAAPVGGGGAVWTGEPVAGAAPAVVADGASVGAEADEADEDDGGVEDGIPAALDAGPFPGGDVPAPGVGGGDPGPGGVVPPGMEPVGVALPPVPDAASAVCAAAAGPEGEPGPAEAAAGPPGPPTVPAAELLPSAWAAGEGAGVAGPGRPAAVFDAFGPPPGDDETGPVAAAGAEPVDAVDA